MVRIVAYDVASDRRLRKVAAICEDFGCRIEKSLFRCTLSEARFEQLRLRLTRILSPEEDHLIIFSLCEHCAERIWSFGPPTPIPDTAAPAIIL